MIAGIRIVTPNCLGFERVQFFLGRKPCFQNWGISVQKWGKTVYYIILVAFFLWVRGVAAPRKFIDSVTFPDSHQNKSYFCFTNKTCFVRDETVFANRSVFVQFCHSVSCLCSIVLPNVRPKTNNGNRQERLDQRLESMCGARETWNTACQTFNEK